MLIANEFMLIRVLEVVVMAILLYLATLNLRERCVRVESLFYMPTLFLFWSIYNVLVTTQLFEFFLMIMFIFILLGMLVGAALGTKYKPLRYVRGGNFIIRPALYVPAFLVAVSVLLQFLIYACSPLFLEIYQDEIYSLYFSGFFGLTTGILWGGALCLFVRWYGRDIMVDKL